MARSEEFGVRRLWGGLLIPVCIFLALGLFSYDWRDINLLKMPPNDPPFNLIGTVGAWISYFLFTILGIGAYAVPFWLLLLSLLLIFAQDRRIWPRFAWGLVTVVALSSLMELQNASWQVLCRKLNLADAGGIFCHRLVQDLLVNWLNTVGAGILVWTLFLVSLFMFIGLSNLWIAARAGWALALQVASRVDQYLEERQDRRMQIEREEKELEKQRAKLERELRRRERLLGDTPSAPTQAPEPQPEPEPEPPPAVTTPARPESPSVLSRVMAAVSKKPDAEPTPEALPKADEPEPVVEAPGEPEVEEPPPPARPAPAPRTRPPPPQVSEDEEEAGSRSGVLAAVTAPYELPPMSLLATPPRGRTALTSTADTATTSKVLVETLADFGIEGQVTNVEVGPMVTSYELLPAPGVKVSRISGLANDLALSLKATTVRVQAPIPGKGVVGIEVPNTCTNIVYLREMLESDVWKQPKWKLPLALGKDVGGNNMVADLADMPHMLIAGATGSGKTVCMNSILAGLLMSRTPAQMRLMLVDPKIVEFSAYNNLPHLVVPVITDPKKVALGLRWAINEMEKRYKLFARVGVRNIHSYNTREKVRQPDLFAEPSAAPNPDEPPATVPYIVIVIDELADLMLAAKADIENSIARLAQLSRAVGIHMIIATQRPSVNVITGTIKANFPARIAFQVAQKVDSRTILDTIGAEKLLGRGDMLFLPPGTSKLVRAQGAMTTDDEIHRIADLIRTQAQPVFEPEIMGKMDKPASVVMDDGEADEDLLAQAVAIIKETRRASTSSLQRRLRLGYTRAARVMDILEERGIVGPPRGSDPREILIDLDGEIPNNPNE
jgi:S-DNA-T family DNA segregation ATPase FtsK/SpoIIIE